MLNWNLMKQPVNWFTITLMLLIGLMLWHFLAKHVQFHAQNP